eukprot:6366519-Pyramimonas_sp.AAC.1
MSNDCGEGGKADWYRMFRMDDFLSILARCSSFGHVVKKLIQVLLTELFGRVMGCLGALKRADGIVRLLRITWASLFDVCMRWLRVLLLPGLLPSRPLFSHLRVRARPLSRRLRTARASAPAPPARLQ